MTRIDRTDGGKVQGQFLTAANSAAAAASYPPPFSELRCKAINPDNATELSQLISLFERCYGHRYATRGAYNSRFWRNVLGTRVISFALLCEGRIVGHIGFRRPAPDGIIQTTLLVIDPSMSQLIPYFAQQIDHFLAVRRERDRWRFIYHYLQDDPPIEIEILVATLRYSPLALLPGCTARARESSRSAECSPASVLLLGRALEDESCDARTLFVPERRLAAIRSLYAPLHFQRRFISGRETSDSPESYPGDGVATALPVRGHALGLFVSPSTNPANLDRPPHPRRPGTLIYANLLDNGCPDYCDTLEQEGFSFVGVAPLLRGRDSILYFSGGDEDALSHRSRHFSHTIPGVGPSAWESNLSESVI